MQNSKIPLIAGVLAVLAVIVTVVTVTSGGGGSGLYVSEVTGDVSLSRSSDGTSAPLENDTLLRSGDVVTVGTDSRCILTYRSKGNSGNNHAVLEPSTQVFVTGEFDGKGDSEMYLNRGAVIVSAMEEDKHNIILRTENSSITTGEAVVRAEFSVGDSNATAVASFGGVSQIQLYDPIGNPVDREGKMGEKGEYLGSGLCGSILSGEGGSVPRYDYLNINTELSEYTKTTLRELLAISSGATLAFTPADIKAAFDAAPDNAGTMPDESTTTTGTSVSVTEITLPSETVTEPPADTAETTELPAETTAPPVTTTRATTTATPVTTTAAPVTTTEAPVTTTSVTTTTAADTTEEPLIDDDPGDVSGGEGEYIDVYIMVDDEIFTQSVPYGGSAEKPADPYVEGKRFVGWDGSFDNITEERTISAMFEDDPSVTTTVEATYHDVTVNINGQLTVQQVQHGGSAQLPAVNVPGYDFAGWDKTGVNITQDETITAILIPQSGGVTASYTVTFIIDGASYPVTVQAGQNAVPPYVPSMNAAGQYFLGWDNDITSVNSDRTVNAIFG